MPWYLPATQQSTHLGVQRRAHHEAGCGEDRGGAAVDRMAAGSPAGGVIVRPGDVHRIDRRAPGMEVTHS